MALFSRNARQRFSRVRTARRRRGGVCGPRRRSFAISPPEKAAPWMGERLSMPDMLPVVGETPRHRGFWCRFGHGHRGFTLGPATGALLAAWMEGERDPITCALSPTRANLG